MVDVAELIIKVSIGRIVHRINNTSDRNIYIIAGNGALIHVLAGVQEGSSVVVIVSSNHYGEDSFQKLLASYTERVYFQ